ncbi:MAG: hydroxymethylglutaryl-CoA reductase (NADPH) [Candidatus Peregrinibacteria bacterium Greene0416_19]|nr:MAG: hydroxymethylglutaryl-CoA reductase (NADPH) [Candidatus Peregrinibacteria bacterium Greene0416_19]
MDLRSLSDGLEPAQRCEERRRRVEAALGLDLSPLAVNPLTVGHADEKNCEQMFGQVPLPVGYAGPLAVTFSSGENQSIHLPLVTTEGALVASVNRGCKALTLSGGARTTSIHHGMTRSMAFKRSAVCRQSSADIHERASEWKAAAEATSSHLKIMRYDLDEVDDHLFLTIACDTDEAMGMNMVTIAAQAVGEWIEQNIHGLRFITVAANVDSDKKPSKRTHDRGRGYEVNAQATIPKGVIEGVLKSTPEALLDVSRAKLEIGSRLAGAVGRNLHAANIIAALYLATGQDAAHVVEGSLADTFVETDGDGIRIRVRLPAILVGIRGGGTELPAQSQCLAMLLGSRTNLHRNTQLAESIGAAVLAGELSLLAAQAEHELAKAHSTLGRYDP